LHEKRDPLRREKRGPLYAKKVGGMLRYPGLSYAKKGARCDTKKGGQLYAKKGGLSLKKIPPSYAKKRGRGVHEKGDGGLHETERASSLKREGNVCFEGASEHEKQGVHTKKRRGCMKKGRGATNKHFSSHIRSYAPKQSKALGHKNLAPPVDQYTSLFADNHVKPM